MTTDGEYTIEWDINNINNRTIWFNFIGACNITLSVISTSSVQTTLTWTNVQVPRWHGIEQPFGDIWTILDGFLMDIIDTNQTKVYICKNPEYFSSTLTENYKLIGTTLYQNGWGKSWKFTSEADLLTESVGANLTSGICDYYYITTTNM
nr:MAG TPA: tail collar fiber protein [Bacteriophage sp.]